MKKNIMSAVVILFLVAITASFSFAGGPAPEKGSAKTKMEQAVVLKGRIDYIQQVDQFFVRSAEMPPTDLMVVNPNQKILNQIFKSGKTVTVHGRLSGGADLLFIEKIDGKAYTGAVK